MENNATSLETLFEKAENYGKTSVELLKLQAVDKSADIVSSLATQLAIFSVVVLFVFTINVGIALWIGEALGKSYYGFFVVSGFYLVVYALLYIFKDQWIKIPVTNAVIEQMINKKLL